MKMRNERIWTIIHTITICTMVNFNCDNNGHGPKIVTCKQIYRKTCKIVHDYLFASCQYHIYTTLLFRSPISEETALVELHGESGELFVHLELTHPQQRAQQSRETSERSAAH